MRPLKTYGQRQLSHYDDQGISIPHHRTACGAQNGLITASSCSASHRAQSIRDDPRGEPNGPKVIRR